MIQFRLSSAGLSRMRFAYSPLAETAKSLYVVHSGRVHPVHREWYSRVRPDLHRVDGELLRAVVPPGGHVAEFLFVGATGTGTTIEDQLHLVASWPHDHFVSELEQAWRGVGMSPAARRVLEDPDGPRRAASALEQYWHVAIAPYWSRLRAVLDADVAYRVGRLTRGGLAGVIDDLHPKLVMTEDDIRVSSLVDTSLDGDGLLLVPCVFVWPHLWVELGLTGRPSLTYGARGVGSLWQQDRAEAEDDPLGALLGRSRAEILVALRLPRSTTDLARALGLAPPTVSAHLGVLRRTGLVRSWRQGRRVLYERTSVAAVMMAAGGYDEDGRRASSDAP